MQEILAENYATVEASGNGFYDAVEGINTRTRYDAIVIDEGQDYDVDMGLTMRALLVPNFTTFYVFFDENQNVFAKDFSNSFAIEAPPIILRYNIRNTGRIYDNATSKTGLGLETVANNLLGVEPEYREYKNAQQCLTALTNIVNRLTVNEQVPSKSIVVLSNKSFEKSVLSTESGIGRLGIDKSEKFDIIDADTIRFFTVPSFKGMEADIIIFLNHVKKHEGLSKEEICAQYVALTRARYYLYVLNILNQE
jgi:DNA helicase IV